MSAIDRSYYTLLAAQPSFRSRVDRTRAWLRDRLRSLEYVSFSGGKDSVVLAHLCLSVDATLPLLCVDPGVPYHWTADERATIVAWARSIGHLEVFPWDKWGTTQAAGIADEAAYREAIHAQQFADVEVWAVDHGKTRRLTGMRIAEGGSRATFLRGCRGETAHTLHPLWQWSTDEVWAYLVSRRLPWLSIYDHLGPEARNGLVGRNGATRGRLVYLKRFYPEAFARACDLFPARDYV